MLRLCLNRNLSIVCNLFGGFAVDASFFSFPIGERRMYMYQLRSPENGYNINVIANYPHNKGAFLGHPLTKDDDGHHQLKK